MSFLTEKPVAIIHDHTLEYNPIAAELWGRDIPVVAIDPRHLTFDPSQKPDEYSLVLNDLGGSGFAFESSFVKSLVLYTRHLESSFRFSQGRIINGGNALEVLTNRVSQSSLFSVLGIKQPRTLVVASIDTLIRNLHSFSFPVLIKSNSAGAGSKTLCFDSLDAVIDAIFSEQLDISGDPWLLQEMAEPKGGHILRIDTLNGNFLDARKVYTLKDASGSQVSEPVEPPHSLLRRAEDVVRAAKVDLGSVELFLDRKTNDAFFYGIVPYTYRRREDPEGTSLSKIADYIAKRLSKIREMELSL